MDTRDTGDHPRPVTGADVVRVARTFLGVPYTHQGRGRGGIDCIGLPLMVAIELGLIPRIVGPTDYGRMSQSMLLDHAARWMTQIWHPVPGAVLILKWPRSPFASHCGIFGGKTPTGDSIIHAYGGARSVVEHNYSGIWVRMLDSVWMLRGVDA